MTNITELLGNEGPLADRLPGFSPREEQQRMAEAIEQAISTQESLIVEA